MYSILEKKPGPYTAEARKLIGNALYSSRWITRFVWLIAQFNQNEMQFATRRV